MSDKERIARLEKYVMRLEDAVVFLYDKQVDQLGNGKWRRYPTQGPVAGIRRRQKRREAGPK